MLVRFEGRDWDLDLTDINLKPAMVIQGYTGLTVQGFVDSITDEIGPELDGDGKPVLGGDGEPKLVVLVAAADKPGFLKSLAAVYWLMKAQNGVQCPIADVDFPIGAFSAAVGEAFEAENAAAEPDPVPVPDPTRPAPASGPSPEPSFPTPGLVPGERGSPHG